jgi:lipopolysaccharide/colanic/teichoic acid biosynthesis glycosyltransferase
MSRIYIQKILLTTIIEIIAVAFSFFIAYSLRSMRDWIPFIQLPMPYISYEQFIPFVISGVCIWLLIWLKWWLYSLRPQTPIIEEIRLVLTYSFLWFFVYIGFVYLSTGFLFIHDIPRLIILYTYIIATTIVIIIRYTIYSIYISLYKKWKIKKEVILVIGDNKESSKLDTTEILEYIYLNADDDTKIEEHIRSKKISSIVYLCDQSKIWNIFNLAKIYGIPLMYPKVSSYTPLSSVSENWIWNKPMIELSPVSITAWWRIAKRIFDITVSSIALILLIPVFIIVSIWIWISDPAGPIIYKNRRIGQNGKIFALYKFRYMYWKYCTKEEYGINDDAMAYEEKLKKEKNTREWPLYKIADDPRKMPWWKYIEKLSIDELPQLFNVLVWDMSLIGPRPHQPREIDLYDESDKQVLTVKPGITGMAQVYGRDKNSFKDEISLDTYYIEHYSASLDIAIILRTILVVLARVWSK